MRVAVIRGGITQSRKSEAPFRDMRRSVTTWHAKFAATLVLLNQSGFNRRTLRAQCPRKPSRQRRSLHIQSSAAFARTTPSKHACGHRVNPGPAPVQPARGHCRAGVCQHPPQQAAAPLPPARQVQGKHPVAPVRSRAQHREAGQDWHRRQQERLENDQNSSNKPPLGHRRLLVPMP